MPQTFTPPTATPANQPQARAAPAATDTTARAAPKTSTAKPATDQSWSQWVQKFENEQTFPILATLLGALLVSLIGIFGKRLLAAGRQLLAWTKPAAEGNYLPQPLASGLPPLAGRYVPNGLRIWQGNQWQPSSQSALDYLRAACRPTAPGNPTRAEALLLLGPTGIGKTTLLTRLYEQHRQNTRWWNRMKRRQWRQTTPRLLLGRVPDWNTDDIERARQAKLTPSAAPVPAHAAQKPEPTLTAQVIRLLQTGRSRQTILLLDGLDEFRLQHEAESFTDQFQSFWRQFQRIIPEFDLVVVTAREQLFHSSLDEQFNFQKHNRTHTGQKLQLLPFATEVQRNLFLTQSFPSAPHSRLHSYLRQLYEKGQTYWELPLLLTHFTEVEQRYGGANAWPDNVQIAELLITKWLERERHDKGVDDEGLRQFCQHLAFRMATQAGSAGSHSLVLNSQQLQELEADTTLVVGQRHIVQALHGLDDRSLLTVLREPRPGAYGEEFRFKFVHERFLEYFLAGYVEAHGGPELLANHAFAPIYLNYFLGRRWRAAWQAGQLPEPPKRLASENAVSPERLRAWADFFASLATTPDMRSYLREHWEAILDREYADWRELPEFKCLRNTVITPKNLWEADDLKAQEGISYLRNFVTKILLKDVPLQEYHWDSLVGAKHIEVVDLDNTGLPAERLADLATTAPSLTQLGLNGIHLDEYPLPWLAQARHLTHLNLSDTNLPAEHLADLAAAAPNLKVLIMIGVQLDKYSLPWLAQARQLTHLDLSGTNLPAERLADLATVAPNLKLLSLAKLQLNEYTLPWLAQTQQLSHLNLNDTGLPAERLADLAATAPSLAELGLNGIQLDKYPLPWLAQARHLTHLNLSDTNLPAERLADLAAAAPNLEVLVLERLELNEYSLPWLAQARHLTHLSLDNTGLLAQRLTDLAAASNLVVLSLAGLQLDEDSLSWLAQARKLDTLNLNDTRLPAAALSFLEGAATTLTYLDVSDNPEITEAAFDRFVENKVARDKLMTLARQAGWEPETPAE